MVLENANVYKLDLSKSICQNQFHFYCISIRIDWLDGIAMCILFYILSELSGMLYIVTLNI